MLSAGLLVVLVAMETQAQGRSPRPSQPPAAPPPSSQGENFSAGKPPAQLFQSDCTGAGCHSRPQGLSKDRGQGSLAGFLREHYTNSRESAGALAGYLANLPPEARPARPERPPRAAATRPEDDPEAAARQRRTATPVPPVEVPGIDAVRPEPAKPAPPVAARPPQRPRQQTSAGPAAVPEPAPALEAAPSPPEPPKPKPPEFDIFD